MPGSVALIGRSRSNVMRVFPAAMCFVFVIVVLDWRALRRYDIGAALSCKFRCFGYGTDGLRSPNTRLLRRGRLIAPRHLLAIDNGTINQSH